LDSLDKMLKWGHELEVSQIDILLNAQRPSILSPSEGVAVKLYLEIVHVIGENNPVALYTFFA
jgi:hypothetical protein